MRIVSATGGVGYRVPPDLSVLFEKAQGERALPNQGSGAPAIVYENVEVRYSDYVCALRDFNLSVQKGEFLFLVGRTGSGKSTILKLLSREAKETAGRVTLAGRDLATIEGSEIPSLRRKMGIVPQDFALLPRKRVWENVGYAMRAVGATRKEVRQRVPDILERVGIGHRADAFPHELSGGEQQRVAIARALINNPPLLLADEPTGNLDPEVSWEIMSILQQLNLRGTTVIVASHDVLMVEAMGRRVVTLSGGRIVSDVRPGEAAIMEAPAEEEEIVLNGTATNGVVHNGESNGQSHLSDPLWKQEPLPEALDA